MARRAPVALASLALLFLLAGCGGGGDEQPTDPGEPSSELTTVEVSPSSAELNALDATQDFDATARDQDGSTISGVDFSWSLTPDSVGSVDTGGTATARANGTATVEAEAQGVTGSAQLTVDQEAAAVAVSPEADTLRSEGDTTRYDAEAEDANGNPVADAAFDWAVSDTAVATVDTAGLVTAKANGTVAVAASETESGVADSASVTVALDAPTLSSVSPDPFVEEDGGTLTGEDFSPDPSSNRVLVGTLEATVTSASETELQITVPDFDCRPPRDVDVTVEVGGLASNAVSHPVEPEEAPVSVAVGEQSVTQDPGSFCLQFEETTSSESYLVGVQSASEQAGALSAVEVTSETGGGGSSAAVAPRPDGGGAAGGAAPGGLLEAGTRHARAEAQIRSWEREHLGPMVARSLPATGADPTVFAVVDSTASEDDTVNVRVPVGPDLCADFTEITGVVRKVGQHGLWVEDVANPDSGYTASDYEEMSDDFDADIHPTDTDYFGSPSDLDDNDGIALVITKEVNELDDPPLGFVFGGDLFDRSDCASSDEGELTYLRAPDPTGSVGPEYTLEEARARQPNLVAHEFTHIIQNARRFQAGDPFMSAWNAEAQAQLAEEVVGHAVTGRTTGQNYGYTVAFNANDSDETDWYRDGFVDLARWYGFEDRDNRVATAPEECSWLQEDPSPCAGRAKWYGVGWSFLRWISDHLGPNHAGGEQGLHRDLIGSSQTGYAAIEDVVGTPVPDLFPQWAGALWVDDRVSGAVERLTLPSWDLKDVEDELPETAHLKPEGFGFTDFTASFDVTSASSLYLLVEGDGRPATAVKVRAPDGSTLGSQMQLWVVRAN